MINFTTPIVVSKLDVKKLCKPENLHNLLKKYRNQNGFVLLQCRNCPEMFFSIEGYIAHEMSRKVSKVAKRKICEMKENKKCLICKEKSCFLNQSQLATHLRTYHTFNKPFDVDYSRLRANVIDSGVFQCPKCYRAFDEKCMIDKHFCRMVTVPEPLGKYYCCVCEALFKEESMLHQHITLDH